MAEIISAGIIWSAAFLLGSRHFGMLTAKTFCNVDPRYAGSGNVGATNVSRLCGTTWGVLTLACDLLKGFLPVLVFVLSGHNLDYLAYAAGLGSICGHMFSIFLNFKGGKGVATTVGVFLALGPLQLVIAGLCCIAVIWRTDYVSAGSLVLVSSLPLLFLFSGRFTDAVFALMVAVLVIVAHRENIVRLRRGEEKPWRKRY